MVLKTFIAECHYDFSDIDDKVELQATDLNSAKNIARKTLENDRCHILKVYEKIRIKNKY